jgi:hypothetical protein
MVAVQNHMPAGSTLALLSVPFIFTQDQLLTSRDFVKKAKERGFELSIDRLQQFHRHNLLVPFYRVTDTAAGGRRIDVHIEGNYNVRLWALHAAAEGRLRDSAAEGYSQAWPYRRPDGAPDDWWDGFAFSSWQLINLHHALNEYEFIAHRWRGAGISPARAALNRRLSLILAVLAPLYLPGVLGRVALPPGVTQDRLWRFRTESNLLDLLQLASFPPDRLRREAETLLLDAASRDPLDRWLPLMRYASYAGWTKLKGVPLDCMWQRVAAEMLLRAHEELATLGLVEPLPDVTGSHWHSPLHDRLTPRHQDADTLERALGTFGLSPHPRVLILVEGETELDHITRLLAEFGLTQPQQVRVQQGEGSWVNPNLITRYNITPRIGRRLNDRWLLDATPTALLITMDPENKWSSGEKLDEERRKLQDAIREEVRWQGADIRQEDLDLLVTIQTWGANTYELANFTDHELIPAIRQLAKDQSNPFVGSDDWEARLQAELQAARTAHQDIRVPIGRMRIRNDKVELAKLLWPVLVAKCEREMEQDDVRTPVLNVVLHANRLVSQLSSGGYALIVPDDFIEAP